MSRLLLAFGVLLLTEAGSRRIPLALLGGFTTMFLGDILWALGKVGGGYLPGGLQDVLYVACYLPIAAAAHGQLRAVSTLARPSSSISNSLAQALPYTSMLAAFLLLVYLARAEVSGPVADMTIVVFVVTLLIMLRQGVMLRDDAKMRERRVKELVEARYASLIATASDVILIVAPDGGLQFASPAFERTFGVKPDDVVGRNLLDVWTGDDGARLQIFLAEVAATPAGAVGPVELHVERGGERFTLEIVGAT